MNSPGGFHSKSTEGISSFPKDPKEEGKGLWLRSREGTGGGRSINTPHLAWVTGLWGSASLYRWRNDCSNGEINWGHTVSGRAGFRACLPLCFPGPAGELDSMGLNPTKLSRATLTKLLNLSRPPSGSESALRLGHQPWQALIRLWLGSLFSTALVNRWK